MPKANDELPIIRMSPKQAVIAAQLAGWPHDQLATLVAIGQQESGLDVAVENEVGADGWLQVLKSSHPDLFSKLPNPYAWVDPTTNARMAKSIYDDRGSFAPWKAYTTDAYKKYLPSAQQAVAQVDHDTALMNADQVKAYRVQQLTPVIGKIAAVQLLKPAADALGIVAQETGDLTAAAAQSTADVLKSMAMDLQGFSDFFSKLLLPSTWMRVGAGLVGAGLVVAGLITLGKEAGA